MILSDMSIRRPVLATVMSLLIVLIGFISYGRLSVREYPNIDTASKNIFKCMYLIIRFLLINQKACN